MSNSFGHIPVLFDELVNSIRIFEDRQNVIVDCTLGLGGHAIGILQKMNSGDIFIGFDTDNSNLKLAQKNINEQVKNISEIKTYFINSNFENIKEELNKIGISHITGVYYDLGVSSVHFDNGERGFSFRFDEKLDMRLNIDSEDKTAIDVINGYSENDLYRIFRDYGEEPKTKFIVDEILSYRKTKKIETTKELASIIEKSSFDPKSKTRVFQAIRMEVNNELGVIEKSLKNVVGILDKGGTIFVISFHSLEDRTVKNIFQEFSKGEIDDFTGQYTVAPALKKVNKKPIIPTQKEMNENSRSRSAKARCMVKIN